MTIRAGTLQAASIIVRSGRIHLGDNEKGKGGGLKATSGNINFHEGTALITQGGMSLVSLSKRGNALAFYAGATLDVSASPLAVNTGRLLMHGAFRIGGIDEDPFLLNYVSVDQGDGRAVIGPNFQMEFTESFLNACRESPESFVPNAVIIDAVITHVPDENNDVWERHFDTAAGRFVVSAKTGVNGDEGGGLRLSYLG